MGTQSEIGGTNQRIWEERSGLSAYQPIFGDEGSASIGGEQSQELLDAASGALERLASRSSESVDEWAGRLTSTFFADLDCPIGYTQI